jgi:hypothetical protein
MSTRRQVSTVLRTAGLASLLLAAGATTALAQSAGPATRFTKWVCVIDLQDALGTDFNLVQVPAKIITTQTEKLCPGSQPNNVSITCSATVDNWTLGNKVYTGFTCQLFKGQCGAPGFVLANSSQLAIRPDGSAELTCSSP